MKLGVLVAAAVAACTLTATAGAHIVHPGCTSKLSPRAELACARTNRQHALATIVWARATQRTVRFLDATPAFRLQRVVDDHRWLYRVMSVRVAEAQRRIAAAARPAHYALWSCITNGAYPGAAHEGNGYNGSYSGPLGMTTPWAGHYPPGSDWVHSDVVAVYAIAEKEYANRGYSSAWLRGQWPNTSPPCIGSG